MNKTQWMSGGMNGGDQGRRVTSVKSDGRESTGNVASPEVAFIAHKLLLDKDNKRGCAC